MIKEGALIPFNRSQETADSTTWQEFIERANEAGSMLHRAYDESPVQRREYARRVCQGGYNFGKTVGWVVNYAPHPQALENIVSALEAIVNWPNAGSVAWEMRRFIKFSRARGYKNVPDVVEFGELIKKIGNDDPTNQNEFQISMDTLYWDSSWGVDGESTEEEILQGHCINVTNVISGLKRHAHPEIIDAERLPTQEEIKAEEQEQKAQYWKDFLADAKSHHPQSSFFDILDREELIKRPHHKILTYPAELCEILDSSVWNPNGHQDVSDAVTAYHRQLPYMVVRRADPNWFPSPLPPDYIDWFSTKFENRLKRTLEQKPWLIDFSVKWQEVLQRSFVGGNHRTNHAGEVELVYKNPNFDPNRWFSNEFELKELKPEEEKLFLESVVDITSLSDQQPPVEPPKNSNTLAFSGWKEAYLFRLADGRAFTVFLKHEYGSIYWEGKLVIVTHNGPEPLF